MKRNLLLKSFLILFLTLSISISFGQNKYLSFTEGIKDNSIKQNTLPSRTFSNLKSLDVQITYGFTGAYVSEKKVESKTYNFLYIDGFTKMGQVGAPALPAKSDVIAMPRGAKGKIVILSADYQEYSGYMIHPTLMPARDTEGAAEPTFERDEAIYSANKFFPNNIVEIKKVGLMRGTPLAYVELRPVQFNPITKTIRVYTNIKYKLVTEGGESNFDYVAKENSLHFTNILKRSVINSESIPNGISSEEQKKNRSGAKNYIIITHSEYLSQAKQLANWKRQMGYSVEVVSQSSWTYSQVETAVHSRYASWTPKPDYVLIVGDHTGSYAVPGKVVNTPYSAPDDGPFATDLYITCMDGSSDWHSDMAKGRISVSSSAEATVIVDKIINYEKNPVNDPTYYSNMLSCAQWQDTNDDDGYADRRFCQTSENIRDYLQNEQSYSSSRVYYRETGGGTASVSNLHYNNGYYSNGQLLPSDLRSASFNWSGGASEITNEINAGKFLVFHRDHGYTGGSGWAHPYYTTSSMTSLSNGDLQPVVFSMNCHTGEYQLNNCFAEKFTRMENKGAVGVVAAAYFSLSGYNDAISLGMIDAIWSDPGVYPVFGSGGSGNNYTIGAGNSIYTMGDVVNQGLYSMEQNWGGSTTYEKYEYELFMYFGDPAMKIWTSNPNSNIITATHSSTIDCANNTFSITGSTAGATATLVYNNELLGKTILDGSGAGTISYSLSVAGDVELTISKHNNKPYTATITQNCSGYPPTVLTNDATTITENEAILNGDITTDNGEAVTESGFVFSETSDPVIGGVGVTKYQNSPLVTSGTFSKSLSGLTLNTTYYYKAYAINSNGTAYGDNTSFTTLAPCTPCASEGNMDYQTSMTLVSFNTINNATSKPAAYNDYTAQSTDVEKGSSYDLTVNLNTDGAYTISAKVWIDWNHDCDFDDAEEMYDLGDANGETDGPTSNSPLSVTIPSFALEGNTIMRVSSRYNSAPASCETGFDGEVEDYTVNVLGSSTLPIATVLSTAGCSNSGSVTVSSSKTGTQIFYLRDNSGGAISDWTGDATSHEFIGLVDGTYKGQVEKDGDMSLISSATTLTNTTNTVAPTSVSATVSTICAGGSTTLSYTGGSGDNFTWYSGSCGGTSVTATVTPTVTTAYYGRWENSCGESSCKEITINVDEAVTASAGADANTCNADYQLSGNNPTVGTGFWELVAGGASIANSSTYNSDVTIITSPITLRWNVTNGVCYASDDVTITLNDATSITTQPVSISNANIGESVSFNVVAEGTNLSYQWKLNNIDINGAINDTYNIASVTADDAGNYTVTVTGECGNIASDIVTLSVATSIKELAKFGISIYPNPSTGIFTIELNDISNTNIEISNVSGKIIYRNSAISNKNSIDLSRSAKGIYFIKINNGTKIHVAKIILD